MDISFVSLYLVWYRRQSIYTQVVPSPRVNIPRSSDTKLSFRSLWTETDEKLFSLSRSERKKVYPALNSLLLPSFVPSHSERENPAVFFAGERNLFLSLGRKDGESVAQVKSEEGFAFFIVCVLFGKHRFFLFHA